MIATDMEGSNVCKVHTFDPSGNLVRTFGAVPELAGYEYRDIVVDENNQMIYVVIGGFDNLVAKFAADGTYMGYWEGDFRSANSIAVADNGDIFVADTYYNEVDQYDSDGNLKYSFADDCYRPYHIVTDLTGKLFVADHGNMQIKVYE